MADDLDPQGGPGQALVGQGVGGPPESAALPPWEQVQGSFEQLGAGGDDARRRYEQHRLLSLQRERYAGATEHPAAWLARRAIPFGSAAANTARSLAYGRARARFDAGSPRDDDYELMAAYERLQEADAQEASTTGGALASSAAGIPAVLGEFGLAGRATRGAGAVGEQLATQALARGAPTAAGAVAAPLLNRGVRAGAQLAAQTALVPSMYADQAVQRNMASGRDPTDPRGLASAYGLALMQNAVFNSVGLGEVPGTAGGAVRQRLLRGTGAGMAAQQVNDAVGHLLGEDTNFGLLGDLAQGRLGHAAQRSTVEALTFASFGGLHELSRPRSLLDAYADAMNHLARRGMSAETAGLHIQDVTRPLARLLADNPDPTRSEAMPLADIAPAGPVRDYLRELARSFPVRPAEAPTSFAEPPGGGYGPDALGGTGRQPSLSDLAQGGPRTAPEPAAPPPEAQRPPEEPRPRTDAPITPEQASERLAAEQARLDALPPNAAAVERQREGRPAPEAPAEPARQAQAPAQPAEVRRTGGGQRPEGLSWRPSGTRFDEDVAANRVEFTSPTGRRYVIGHDTWEPGSDRGGEHGAFRVSVQTPGGDEVGHVGFYRLPDGRLEAEGLHVAEGHRSTRQGRSGVSEAMYDYMHALGATVVPSEGQTAEGRRFWDRNQRGDYARPAAQEPAPRRPAAERPEPQPAGEADYESSQSAREQDISKLPPKEKEALLERLMREQQEEMDAEARGGKRRVAGGATDNPLPAAAEESMGRVGLTPAENRALTELLRGNSLRQAGKKMGVSYETVRKLGEAALARLRAADPDLWRGEGSLADFLKAQRESGMADFASRYSSDPYDPSRVGEDGRRVADLIHEMIDSEGTEVTPERGVTVAEEVRRWVIAAEAARVDPVEAIEHEAPGLLARLGSREALTELIQAARELGDDIRSTAADLGTSPASLRREIERALPEGAALHEAAAEGQAGPGERPAATYEGGGAPVDEPGPQAPAVPPAGAEGGAAGGDVLGQADRESSQSAGEPNKAAVARPAEPPPDPVVKMAQEIAAEEGGYLDPEKLREFARGQVDRLWAASRNVADFMAKLGGKQVPVTHRLSPEAAEAMVHHASADEFARQAAPDYTRRVMTDELNTPELRELYGTALHEMRFRYAREKLLQEAYKEEVEASRLRNLGSNEQAREHQRRGTELREASQAVNTFIGAEGSPLKTEADFQNTIASDKFKGVVERFKKEFLVVQEAMFRQAQGMEASDPIETLTQMPGLAFNARSLAEGEAVPREGAVSARPRQGDLRNPRARKYVFANQATLAGERYVTDLGAVIANTLSFGARNATKAEMYRVLMREGLAVRDKPGKRIEVGGLPAHAELAATPPRGPNDVGGPTDVLYFHPAVYPELRQILQVDKPVKAPGIAGLAWAVTKASMFAPVEGLSHLKNNITFLFKPGVSVVDFFKNFYKTVAKDQESQARITELARIGAFSGRGERHTWKNPLNWMHNFLDILNRSMRLTGDQAFDRLIRQGHKLENTEANRRDFINQLGNYNHKTQSALVSFLRNVGLGPFATAGYNYLVQGHRALTFNPGVRAETYGQAALLRARMLAKTLAVASIAPVVNYLLHRRVDGDENTPMGAIFLGRDANGQSMYFDLTALTGFTRGARQLGLTAIAEGLRARAPAGAIADQAARSMIGAALSPAAGPPVQFLHTVRTGQDMMGRRVAARSGRGEGWQMLENLKAALIRTNGFAEAIFAHEPSGRRVGASEKINRLLGPFGVRRRSSPPGRPGER